MSVTDLIKGFTQGASIAPYVQPPERKNQLSNTEGLRDLSAKETIAGSISNRRKLQNRYYADQSIRSKKIKNVSGLSIRDIQQQRYYKPKEWAGVLEGAIDPNKIRSIEDPQDALPRNQTIGGDGGYYELEEDDYREYSNNALLRKAMDSYARARGGLSLSTFVDPSKGLIPATLIPPKP